MKKDMSRRSFMKNSALALGAVVTTNIKGLGRVFAASDISRINLPKNFVAIKGGTFQMGSPDTEPWRGNDEKAHRVTISDFTMGIHE